MTKKKAGKFDAAIEANSRPTPQGLLFADLELPSGSGAVAKPALDTAPHGKVQMLALSKLEPDPGNPRLAVGDVTELAASLEAQGVIEPLVVRPRGEKFRVVVGHRRLAAAKLAKLGEVPCVVRPMTDAQALEVQLAENVQRADLGALEESEGYARLAREHGYTAEEIAERVGSTKGTVIARLKLRSLGPAGRKALEAGELDLTLAVAVARLPSPESQAKFLAAVGGMSVRAALERLRDDHSRSLKSPPFDAKDPDLCPEAGPCNTCPFRGGVTPGYSDDLRGHDACSKPGCFDAKAKATWRARAEKFEASGATVLSLAKGQALFRSGNELQWDGLYVETGAPAPADPKKRTWAQLVGKLPPPLVVAADLKLKPRQLYERAAALKVIAAGGAAWAVAQAVADSREPETSTPGASRARYEDEQRARNARQHAAQEAIARIARATTAVQRPEALLMIDAIDIRPESAVWATRAGPGRAEAWIEAAPLADLLLLAWHALALEALGAAWAGYDERLTALAARHGIDLAEIEAGALAQTQAPRASAGTDPAPE